MTGERFVENAHPAPPWLADYLDGFLRGLKDPSRLSSEEIEARVALDFAPHPPPTEGHVRRHLNCLTCSEAMGTIVPWPCKWARRREFERLLRDQPEKPPAPDTTSVLASLRNEMQCHATRSRELGGPFAGAKARGLELAMALVEVAEQRLANPVRGGAPGG